MRNASDARTTLRGTTTLLVAQVTLLLVLAGGSWWHGLATLRAGGAIERAKHKELHEAEEHLDRLVGVVQGVGQSDEVWRTSAAVDELKRVSARIEEVVRKLGSPQAAVETEEMLGRLAAATSDVLGAPTSEARAAAARRFEEPVHAISRQLRSVEVALVEAANGEGERCIRALLAAMAAAVVLYAATAVPIRRSVLATVRGARLATRESAAALARQLDASVRGLPAAPPEVAPDLAPLVAAIDRIRTELERARDTLRFERGRARFAQELVEALELADGEPEVTATVAHAARVAFPGSGFQLLLADHSHARLLPQLPEAPARCTPASPHACPALRRARTLVHLPDGGMGRCRQLAAGREGVACAPISVRGRAVGVAQLVAASVEPAAVETLTGMSFDVGARLGVVRTLGERELAAATDVLTGLANRRAMNERLAALDQQGGAYAVISADLDHFKRLNDTYGHPVGDRCLRIFAQVLRDASRADDLACRPGGEEFTLVLVGGDEEVADRVAGRIHGLLAEASRRAGLPFTVSLGIAARPAHGAKAEEILRAADSALYAAKDAGRNCTRSVAAVSVLTPVGELSPAA